MLLSVGLTLALTLAENAFSIFGDEASMSRLALPVVLVVGCFGVARTSDSRRVRWLFGVVGGLLTAALVLIAALLIALVVSYMRS